jgi:hypothetical protein
LEKIAGVMERGRSVYAVPAITLSLSTAMTNANDATREIIAGGIGRNNGNNADDSISWLVSLNI